MQKNPDYSDLMQLAQSPAGQRLIALLQKNGSLPQILEAAAAGNYEKAKAQLSTLLDSEEAKGLLRELEGKL